MGGAPPERQPRVVGPGRDFHSALRFVWDSGADRQPAIARPRRSRAFSARVRHHRGRPRPLGSRRERTQGSTYRVVADEYMRLEATRAAKDAREGVFTLYQGSEAYSPAPYLAHVVAAGVGRAFGLDFLGLFYLMLRTGFVALTGG